VTETDLNMEQAMSMLMTGGAVGPESMRFTPPALVSAAAIAEPDAAKPLAPSV